MKEQLNNNLSLSIENNFLIDDCIKNLKVAEVKLLLEPRNSTLKQLIKLTFFDLLFKKVLILKSKASKVDSRSPIRENLIVETGEAFPVYEYSKFEAYFIERIDEESFFYLRSYLRSIIKDIPSNYHFKREIIDSSKCKEFFRNDFFSNLIKNISVNKKGKSLVIDFAIYLNKTNENLLNLIKNQSYEAFHILLKLKGNIFLLNNFKLDFFLKIKSFSSTFLEEEIQLLDNFIESFSVFNFNKEKPDLLNSIDEYFESCFYKVQDHDPTSFDF